MEPTDDLIEYTENELCFEDFRHENGCSYWWATDLMRMLDYKDMKTFQKVLDKATKTCITLKIPHYENFQAVVREINGIQVQDFKLTRFACYLTVMNGDTKIKNVALAQVYFIEQTRKFEMLIQSEQDIDRIYIRDEIKDGNNSLAKTVESAGVEDFARFHNAGYMGMYNMYNFQLAKLRKIEPKDLYDYMGRSELAANLFRITQTEDKIKNLQIKGQANLEQTHFSVGREVRNMMIRNTGKAPEKLPVEKKLPELQKILKKGYRKMLKEDTKKKELPENITEICNEEQKENTQTNDLSINFENNQV